MEGADVFSVHEQSLEFQQNLSEIQSEIERSKCITEYIQHTDDNPFVVPEFAPGLEWFNVEDPLCLRAQLTNKIVVLDFFTYCCINCMHILPDLHALEAKYKDTDGVVIIGVHSAKFDNEKVSANILSAVLRYNITHPVVNDHEAKLWHDLQIQCWPTLVILGPSNQILLILTGEGHRDLLLEFTGIALDHYRNKSQILFKPIGISLVKETIPESPLLFPGKICTNHVGDIIVIADTGHHRILILDFNWTVQATVGSGEIGFKDGSFEQARFHAPQGVCFHHQNVIYVADTENHAIRKIDLMAKTVETIAGTGLQGQDKIGGGMGTQQPISSPWDVELATSPGSTEEDLLFIAMAGTHQIWILFLKDAKWLKGSEHKLGTCLCFAGSGAEENRNNNYPSKAAFAQPSGIAIGCLTPSTPTEYLFVADSESSSIRSVSLKDGSVKNVAGGDIDPTNLFAFGDEDDKGNKAKLQHPLGVTMKDRQAGPLIVADSYNHKIKMVDLPGKQCRTLLGSGKPGNVCGSAPLEVRFNEPGGVCVTPGGKTLYIADTNNHSIKLYDFDTEVCSELTVILSPHIVERKDVEDLSLSNVQHMPKKIAPKSAKHIAKEPVELSKGSQVVVCIDIRLAEGLHLTDGAPSAWQAMMDDPTIMNWLSADRSGKYLEDPLKKIEITMNIPDLVSRENTDLCVEVVLYYCSDDGLCKMKGIVFHQPIKIRSMGAKMERLEFQYEMS